MPMPMIELPRSLPCLLLPLQSGGLLIPNANVVEVVLAAPLTATVAAPFVLGMMPWRDQQVAVISFEGLSEGRMPAQRTLHQVAIVKALNSQQNQHYYGIALAAVPQVLHLSAADLAPVSGEVPEACQAVVTLAGRRLMLPDCDAIETRLGEALALRG